MWVEPVIDSWAVQYMLQTMSAYRSHMASIHMHIFFSYIFIHVQLLQQLADTTALLCNRIATFLPNAQSNTSCLYD